MLAARSEHSVAVDIGLALASGEVIDKRREGDAALSIRGDGLQFFFNPETRDPVSCSR